MKVVTNEALASRRRRQALLASMAGVSILIVGLLVNLRAAGGGQDARQQLMLAYAALVGGSVLSWIGVVLTDRWAGRPRGDEALEAGLKGAGAAYKLYNWVLPAEHVLLTPWGLAVFTVFNHEGPVAIRGKRWRDARPFYRRLLSFGRRAVRDPRGALRLETGALARALLERDEALGEVTIEGVALFSHPALRLSVQEPSLPVVTLTTLRDWLRQEAAERESLSAGQRRRLQRALDEMAAERLEPARD